ncbi:MAG: GAF domain-containing protein [Anaerolineae bacterium]|nr:GAF domain-containing protein [Anaerolineae bacterium]
MHPLKEFAGLIKANLASLAETQARLLIDHSNDFQSTPQDDRIIAARKLLNAVVVACENQTSAPLLEIFDPRNKNSISTWPDSVSAKYELVELECLGQTLNPVLTSLEAGKFFWQLLTETRTIVLNAFNFSVSQPPLTADPDTLEPENLQADLPYSAEFFNTIINSIADPVFAKDEAHRWILLNDSMLEFMGGKREDLLGKSDYDFVPKEEADVFWEQDNKVFASDHPIENEEFLTDAYGNRHIISTKKAAYQLPNGQKILTGTIRDITERKQMDQALRASLRENERLSTAISNASIGVVISDPHQPDNPIIYVNPGFTKLTGYSEEEAIGSNCRFLQGPDTDPLAIDVIRTALKQQKSCSVVLLNYRQDKTPFWNELTINPVFDEDGHLINFVGIQMDVTARQHAENTLLKRAAELETVAQVSIATSTILDVNQLLKEVVELTKGRFNLYHAHIYLLDEQEESLGLTVGAGELGQALVAQGWRIPINREDSLVARAARHRQAVIVYDVRQDPGFLPNPLLPDTRSEMAVPMIVGDKLLGVLDVQSEHVGRFSKEDALIKTTLASQVAVALQNAIQYQQTQKALVEMNRSQDLLRTVIDATPDWIFIKDRQHRYQMVNKGYSDSLGLPIDAFVNKDDLELGFPDEIVKGNPDKGIVGFWNYDNQVFDTGQTIFIDIEPADINGKRVFQNTIKAPIRDNDGNIQGVLGYVRDITERERLLAETKQLYEASAALNKADSYLDVIGVIRSYTIAAEADYISIGHFGRAMAIDDVVPDTVFMLARWSNVSESLVRSEYDFNEFPGFKKYIQPVPVVIDDFSQETIDAKTRALYDSLNAKTLVYMPIAVAGQWNGFFAIIYQQQKSFSDKEIRHTLAVASQISVAVQNLYNLEQAQQNATEAERGRQQLAQYSERLHRLQDITRTMGREPKPSLATYQKSLGDMAQLVQARYAALALFNEKGEYSHFLYYGISEEEAKLIGDLPTGRGLLGVVPREGQALRIENIEHDNRSTPLPDHHPQMTNFLGVPIIFQDQHLGRIYFTNHLVGEFGPDDEALATSFAASLASTLQSAKLFETTQKRAKELEIVSELGIQISTVLDPNLLLSSVVDLTLESFNLCLVQVYLFNETSNSLELAVASGKYDQMVYEGITIALNEEHSPIAQSARVREAVFIDNLQQKRGIIQLSQFPYAQAEIATPLISGQNLLGILDVQTDEPNRFTDEDVQIQKILAGQVAIALDNVHLFEQLQRRALREQTIREIAEKMRTATSLEQLVKVTATELGRSFSADYVLVDVGGEQPSDKALNGSE